MNKKPQFFGIFLTKNAKMTIFQMGSASKINPNT